MTLNSPTPAVYGFKLRSNILLEDDLLLARMELSAFLPSVLDVPSLETVTLGIPVLGQLTGFASSTAYTRRTGQQGYRAEAPLAILPELIRCLSFVQQIYCLTANTPEARQFVREIEAARGAVVTTHADGGHLLIYALPHYALFELSEVVVRRSKNAAETRRNLVLLLDALMGRTSDPRALALAETALAAQSTTAHLSHDLHYYKAKFFPRMARAMLNVCSRRLGEGTHRVLDNFVGSGTTLLESTVLGIPSVGLDLDPLSVLIAQTKLAVLQLDSALVEQEASQAIQRLPSHPNGQMGLFDTALSANGHREVTFPAWLLKNRRMTPQIAAELSAEINTVRAAISACDPRVGDLFRVLLSDAITRRIRMRFMGTGVGRFSLTFSQTKLPDLFARSLARYARVVATIQWLRETLHLTPADARVRSADARHLPADLGTFDILLTSPPYLPASSGRESYAKARAPSLIALDMVNHESVDTLVEDSIGSMDAAPVDLSLLSEAAHSAVTWLQNDPLRAPKADPTARYFLDMRQSFAEAFRVLRPGGLAVFVSGKDSTFYRFASREPLYVVHAAELLADEARLAGFEVEALHDLPLKKANVNARPRSLDDYYETLILLRKPDI